MTDESKARWVPGLLIGATLLLTLAGLGAWQIPAIVCPRCDGHGGGFAILQPQGSASPAIRQDHPCVFCANRLKVSLLKYWTWVRAAEESKARERAINALPR